MRCRFEAPASHIFCGRARTLGAFFWFCLSARRTAVCFFRFGFRLLAASLLLATHMADLFALFDLNEPAPEDDDGNVGIDLNEPQDDEDDDAVPVPALDDDDVGVDEDDEDDGVDDEDVDDGGGDGGVDDGGHEHDNGNASVRKASVLQGKEGS